MQNLSEAKIGKTYSIVGFDDFLSVKVLRRLCDLGLTKGQKVTVTHRSLLKKAILFEIRGYMLSLKTLLAKGVLVE